MLLPAAFTTALLLALGTAGSRRLTTPRRLPVSDGSDSSPTRRRWSGFTKRRRRRLWGCIAASSALLLGGVALTVTLIAATWGLVRVRSLLRQRATSAARQAALPDAIDTFVLLVHAGLTPQLAVEHLARTAPTTVRSAFAAVGLRTRRGEPFADALGALLEHFGNSAAALVDLVASSSRYGLPMANVLAQLSSETRATRRRLDEAAARALPVRLSFPLVACTLPSFVLLAIAPAVLAALSSLGDTSW